MSQPLPTRDFELLDNDQINALNIDTIAADPDIGYIFECDLEYPHELHDAHNDYPLAPEHMIITDDMLSPFQREHFPPTRSNIHKLVPNLRNKEKYVIHHRNLQLYTSLGMRITHIHRVIKFTQSTWLADYIDFNTEKRKEAVRNNDSAGKDLFKLMNNAVFGKTMENLRNRVDIELVQSRKMALKRFAKPNFKRAKKFRENLVAIHVAKPVLVLNRPIQVGFAILELSKVHMYNFHYNVWMRKFPQSTLLFTDTDSLAYAVDNDDLYAGMASISEEFRF